MTDEALITNISDMIDLAIGTPEVGVVDFSMLQTVLHCLAQQLRVLGKNVELRGSMAALPVTRGENAQTITISEFIVDTQAPGKFNLATEPPAPDQESMLVVERVKKNDAAAQAATTGGGAQQRAGGGVQQTSQPPSHGQETTARGPSTEKLSLVTLSKFNLLENTVAEIKSRVFGTSPKNEEILQEVRSQSNVRAITDMWNNMNVASRLDAAEEGIGKLSSLIEDLIKETVELQKTVGAAPSPAAARMVEEANALSKTPAGGADAGGPGSGLTSASRPETPSGHGMPGAPGTPSQMQATSVHDANAATKDELKEMMHHLQRLRKDVEELTNTFNNALKEVNPSFVPAAVSAASDIALTSKGGAAGAGGTESDLEAQNRMEGRLLEKLNNLEKDLKKCCDSVKKSDGLVHDQMTSFQDQLEYMTKQIADLSAQSTFGSDQLSPTLVKDLQGLMKLFETVQNMQTELQHVHKTALELAAEKEDRQNHIDALLEQIELLKVIKLDREDMVEALADKADLRMLARKVSHDQFESACDDLSKGLEHALGKLNVQESLWQQALDDIQREIEQKLDKMELSPVKDFFNKKLKQLQENLKQMAALRREAEAAGTKRRLLRDVNCISCDAKAVMAMDAPTAMPPKPLQPTMSMKPYLTYELDAIRKTQASNLPQRNLHDWENVQQQIQQKPQKVRSETDKHLCNRYCGGSHTVTTPAQRVARLGHFIKQWGPEVLPLSSGFAAGDDGRLYKTSTMEGANVGPEGASAVCTPRVTKKADAHKDAMPGITLECRCLDPTDRTKN